MQRPDVDAGARMAELVCSYYTVAGVSPQKGGASPLPFEARVRACAEAGYAGVGAHLRDYRHLRQAGASDQELASVLRVNGMRCTEVEFLTNWFASGGLEQQARRDEDDLYRAAHALGAPLMFLTGTLAAGQQASFDRMTERFAAVCERARRQGLIVGVEPCAWSDIAEPDDAQRLIEAAGVSNAGLYLDVWHLFRRGYDYHRLAAIPAETIVGVQLDDAYVQVRGDGLVADCLDHRALPGRGAAQTAAFVQVLLRIGYAGPFSVEVISKAQRRRPLKDAAAISLRAAARTLARARQG